MTRHLVAVVVVALCGLPSVSAQDATPPESQAPPPHLSIVEGAATLQHDGLSEEATVNMPLAPGDRLITDRGRIEVLFGGGSLLHLDERTTLDIQSETLFRLLAGRVIVVAGRELVGRLRIDAPAASIDIQAVGEYRISLGGPSGVDVDLAVLRGQALLQTNRATTVVGAGQMAFARDGLAPSTPQPFNSARWDEFDRWSQARIDAYRGATTYAAAQYVPPPIYSYSGVLAQYGSWGHAAPYGYVWYPTVAVGWKPYYHGRWKHYGRYGWTWVGFDPWAWPTHHYGRWGITGTGRWYWIPGRHWGSAWVSWGTAPGFVSWCPLGFDNRPVLGVWGSRAAYGYGRGLGAGHAWTAVPTGAFGRVRSVSRVVVDGSSLIGPRAPAFVVQQRPPNVAVPRGERWVSGTQPVRDVAVPRSGSLGVAGASLSAPPAWRGSDGGANGSRGFGAGSGSPISGSTLGDRTVDAPATPAWRAPQSSGWTTERGIAVRRGQPSAAPDEGQGAAVTAPGWQRAEPSARRAVPQRPDQPAPMYRQPATSPPSSPGAYDGGRFDRARGGDGPSAVSRGSATASPSGSGSSQRASAPPSRGEAPQSRGDAASGGRRAPSGESTGAAAPRSGSPRRR
jgi:hypothetical protein